MVYNEAGQVWNKQLHSTDSVNFLQTVAYTYNERGWLLQSTSPVFEEQLQYNQVAGISGISPVAQYNGNIASQSWGTGAAPNGSSFVYSYDALNRLTQGRSADNKFIERGISYDLMGNINTLSRVYNSTLIDSMAYAYNSTNQLQSVYDKSPDVGVLVSCQVDNVCFIRIFTIKKARWYDTRLHLQKMNEFNCVQFLARANTVRFNFVMHAFC